MLPETADRAVPGLREVQDAELARLLGFALRARLAYTPLMLLVMVGLALLDLSAPRVALLGSAGALLVALSVLEARRLRRQGYGPTFIPLNMISMGALQLVLLLSTGGLSSPIVPIVVALTLLSSLLVGSDPFRWKLLLLTTSSVCAMALAQTRGWIHLFSPTWLIPVDRPGAEILRPWVMAGALIFMLSVASVLGAKLRDVFDRMLTQALQARRDVLQSYSDQAQELTSLSAEIAHELKNPLTSVKGLAGLLALDLVDGKPAERLSALRREVDRMQSLLDEFLNFSRPLVPLSQSEVDLSRLCAEVVALHEGMGFERGVKLGVSGAGEVRGDPRKLRQILINLVHNAIEASPNGAEVRMRITAEGAAHRIDVEDQGSGLSDAVGGRAFEPGVTTKARGSGLGLTIARALARQHGGELELRNGEHAGCRASLWLPGDVA